jgi:hypothetical protein
MTQRRRRVLEVLGLIVVALGLLAGGAYLWSRQYRARPVSLDEARERLSEVPVAAAPASDRPEAGVYDYAGSGTDRLSPPGLTQSQGPTVPGTVEPLGGGCWRFRVDYSTNHWQSYDWCRTDAGIEEVAAQTFQRWVIGAAPIDNTTKNTCDPGAMVVPATRPEPGQTWTARCDIANDLISGATRSTGTTRYVGRERVTVGGSPVWTLHFQRRRTLSGGQTGTERMDLWLLEATGLPVRNRHEIDVRTKTPIGSSHYTETGEYTLRSLLPI